jgi:hypothetical protein
MDSLPHVSEQQQNKRKVCVCVAYCSPQIPHNVSFIAINAMSVYIAKSGFNKNLLQWGKLVSFHSLHNKGYSQHSNQIAPNEQKSFKHNGIGKKAVEMNKVIYCFIPMKYFPRPFGMYPRRDISNTNVTIK